MDNEADPEQFKKFLDALDRNTDAMVSTTKLKIGQNDSAKKADDAAAKSTKSFWESQRDFASKFNYHVDSLGRNFGKLGGSADHLVDSFSHFARNFVGGAVIGELVKSSYELNKTYKNMTDIGQDFGGSMIEMASQAGAAGLPLSEFTEMLKKNGTAAAALANGNKTSLGSLQLAVRDVTKDVGFYGMSLSQISDLTGDYTETMRQSGRLGKINNQTTAQDIADFSKDITDFSKVTGVARGEIAKATMEAMRDVAISSRDLTDAQSKSATKAISFMASLPGIAGQILPKLLAETVGYGSSIYSDKMKEYASAGGAELVGIFDDIGAKVEKGGAFSDVDIGNDFDKMQRFFRQNNEGLRIQAMAGNANAKELLQLGNSLKGLSGAEFADKMKQQKAMGGLTALFSQLEDQLSRLSGAFVEGLMDPLKDLESSFNTSVPIFDTFKDTFKSAGTALGTWIKSLLDNKQFLIDVGKTFKDFAAFVPTIFHAIGDAAVIIKGIISGLLWAKDKLDNIFGGSENTSRVIEVIGGLILLSPIISKLMGLIGGVFGLVSKFTGMFKSKVTINAASVFVNGATGGGRGFGGGGTGAHPHEPKAPAGGAKGWRKWLGKGLGLAEGAAEGALGGGGGDCCDGLMGGLGDLKDRVDFHGDRAHENAKPAGTAAKAAEEGIETAEKSAGKLGKIGGALGKAGGFLARHAKGLGAVGVALDAGTSGYDEYGKSGSVGRAAVVGGSTAAGGALGGWGGAAMGAAIGTMILPGIGTAIGGLLGGLAGAYAGSTAGGALSHAVLGDPASPTAEADGPPAPATPADQANPFDSSDADALQAKWTEVTDAIKDNLDASKNDSEQIKRMDAGNAMMAELIRLQNEAVQVKAAIDKKQTALLGATKNASETTAQVAGS